MISSVASWPVSLFSLLSNEAATVSELAEIAIPLFARLPSTQSLTSAVTSTLTKELKSVGATMVPAASIVPSSGAASNVRLSSLHAPITRLTEIVPALVTFLTQSRSVALATSLPVKLGGSEEMSNFK